MHKRGFFKRFGLSNFKPAMVEKVYEIAKAKGYVLPTVYQGNFNPAARKIEEDLLPVLRKLNIVSLISCLRTPLTSAVLLCLLSSSWWLLDQDERRH